MKLKMIIDKDILIDIRSSVIIHKLNEIGIYSKIGDMVSISIDKLWMHSNFKINVRCDVCGAEKLLQYNLYNKNVSKYNLYCCSNSCSSVKNKMTNMERYGVENYRNIEKIKKTKLEKYGDENYHNANLCKKTKKDRYGDENYNNSDKAKKTNMERYGVENTFLLPDVIEKSKKTNMERYGVEDSRSSDHVKSKRKSTVIDKYGHDYYMKTDDFRIKSTKTNMERYGFESASKSQIVKDKKVKSMLKKYGYISNSMSDESKYRLRKTNMERYGVEYPMQVLEFFDKQQTSAKRISKYKNLYYQGSYEMDFIIHMENLKLIDILERGHSIRYGFDGHNKIYFPDFYIDKYNLIVEIKSSYTYSKYLDKNIAKMGKCIELGYNFLFIINKNYTALNDILKLNNSN